MIQDPRMTTNISLTEPGRLSATRSEQINQIYISSFPPSERMPFADIEKSIERGDRQLFIATVQDAIAGFALTMYLPVSNMHYLEYLAVRPDLRNLKTGAALLGYLRDHVATTRANGIILEVESELNAPASELEIRKRRLQFYSRNGYGLITCVPDYRVPKPSGNPRTDWRNLPKSTGGWKKILIRRQSHGSSATEDRWRSSTAHAASATWQ